jgi:hypothetical protein
MSEMDALKQRIAALEAKLAKAGKGAEDDDEGKETLASAIEAIEKQLSADDDGDDDDEDDEVVEAKKGADEKVEEKKAEDKPAEEKDEKDEKKAGEVPPEFKEQQQKMKDKAEKKASESAPGIEDESTTDKFREVERLQHGTELATDTGMLQVAPTRSEYQARLKLASARLDNVAEYLERHGRRELAFRIDKIADAIDVKVNGGK